MVSTSSLKLHAPRCQAFNPTTSSTRVKHRQFSSSFSSFQQHQQVQHHHHHHYHQKQSGACSSWSTSRCLASSWTVCSVQVMHELADAVEISAGFNPAQLVLLGGAALMGAAALKFYLYSQLEYVTAAMLTKYVPKGGTGAKVIQLGGGTRELYYYPKDVMTVINVGEKANKGLMEQAGVTAAVPTIVKQQSVADLSFAADSTIDAVVSIGELSQLSQQQRQKCLEEIARVLKPNMPLVFVEPVKEGGSPLRGLVGVSAGKQGLAEAELDNLQSSPAFSYVQFDIALQGQDPHAAGVAVRSDSYNQRKFAGAAEEGVIGQRRKGKQPKVAKGFSN